MRQVSAFFLLACLWTSFHAPTLWAGDEDQAEEKPAVQMEPTIVPEPTPPPQEEKLPDLSAGQQEEVAATPTPAPIRQPTQPARQTVVKKPQKPRAPYNPDLNIDYTEQLSGFDTEPLSKGVLQPALGFRGYRPNMIAVGVGDRTPGVGGMIEYSWNRIGAGVYYSYRVYQQVSAKTFRVVDSSQSFGGLYALYRWLPFDASPYFLFGAEAGSNTIDTVGGLAGIGAEARIYYGITILVGYTYHSTVHDGFFGGSLGWSF